MGNTKKHRQARDDPGNEPPPGSDSDSGWSGTKTLVIGGIALVVPLIVFLTLSQSLWGKLICLALVLAGLKIAFGSYRRFSDY